MKKISLSTDVHVIKTNKIDTLEFRLVYPIKYNNDNVHYIKLLNLFITSTSEKYKEQSVFSKEMLKHTILGISLRELSIVNNTYLIFSFGLPRENLIKNFNIESSFKFAIDALLHPYLDGYSFNASKFEYEKEFLFKNYLRSMDNIYSANSNQFYDYIDPEGKLGNSCERTGEVLKSITPESLYEFYKKNILDNTFIPYVYGSISPSTAKNLFKKYIPQTKKEVSFTTNYFEALPMKEPSYQEINTKYNQSELFLEYQVDMKEKDIKYLTTLVNILTGAENNLIFDALRVKNNLVYDVRLSSFSSRAMFVIIAFIPRDKYKETKKIIKSVFKSLKDEKYLQVCLDKLIKGLEVDLLREEDGQGKLLNDTINHDLNVRTTEDLLAKTKSVSAKKLVEFIDRVELTNEMFFRGE